MSALVSAVPHIMAPVSRTVNLALVATAVAMALKITSKKQNKRKLFKEWLLKGSQYSYIHLLNELQFHPEDQHNCLQLFISHEH